MEAVLAQRISAGLRDGRATPCTAVLDTTLPGAAISPAVISLDAPLPALILPHSGPAAVLSAAGLPIVGSGAATTAMDMAAGQGRCSGRTPTTTCLVTYSLRAILRSVLGVWAVQSLRQPV